MNVLYVTEMGQALGVFNNIPFKLLSWLDSSIVHKLQPDHKKLVK